jgi:phosphatidylglycerol:prolipoprotein diacylglycerol transferase
MYPVLFTIGGFQVRSYYVLLTLGVVLGVWMAGREARKIGFSRQEILPFIAVIIPAGLGGGLLNGWLFDLESYRVLARGRLHCNLNLVSFGMIFAVYFVCWLFTRHAKDDFKKLLDVVTLALPIILGFTRIGCLLNGCCYGKPTSGFGGVYLPGLFGEWAYRYPTQILLMALNAGLFLWLWLIRKRKPFDGNLALLFLIVYAIGRSLIDALRDLPRVLGPFSLLQLTSLVIIAVCLPLYILQHRKHSRNHR